MKTEIFNIKNFEELYQHLDNFAKHHQIKGGQKAYKIIKNIHNQSKADRIPTNPVQRKFEEGYDAAFQEILNTIDSYFCDC
jgi:hypothetical protein